MEKSMAVTESNLYKNTLSEEELTLLNTEGTCYCGKKGVWCVDPYSKDVYGEYNVVCLCDDCYQIACEDI